MTKVRAVVFDSDGTLFDGFPVIVAAYAHVAALHGRPEPTQADIRAQLAQGRPLHDIYRTLIPGIDPEQTVRENGEYIEANFRDMPGFAGLIDILEALHKDGLKLAIFTGGNHKVHDLYRYHGVRDYFTSIVHCDRVQQAKPDPTGLLLAVKECGVTPDEAIMVGDSPNDIFAGKNAGAGCTIGITHGHGSREALIAADADYIVDSLAELQLLIQRLTERD